MLDFRNSNGAMATLLIHPNDHLHDSAAIIVNKNGLVKSWIHEKYEKVWYKNSVNAGIHILSKTILELIKESKTLNLNHDILEKLIAVEGLYAYRSPEYIKDMGTPSRYKEVYDDIVQGKARKKIKI